jgi:two-component system response regulator TctD
MRLLIVEDNPELAELLVKALSGSGFTSDLAATGEDARALLAVAHYAAVILDLGLPDDDGLAVLRDMRAQGDATPVLVLTARSGVDDRVRGLQAGGDDYLIKPFAFEELLARVQALLRRPGALLGRRLEIGNLVFDSMTRETRVDDKGLYVPPREGQILELLLRRVDRVVPKSIVESQLFGNGEELGSNAIEVYVHRLRRRLEQHGAKVRIQTMRGIGYVLSQSPP